MKISSKYEVNRILNILFIIEYWIYVDIKFVICLGFGFCVYFFYRNSCLICKIL